MKKDLWKCNKCGSFDIEQEWVFFRPMNCDYDDRHFEVEKAYENEFFWCPNCDDETTPIKESK